VAREWLDNVKPRWAPVCHSDTLKRFEAFIFPTLGRTPTAGVTAPQPLSLLRKVEACSGVHDASPDCGNSCGPRAWGWQKSATLCRLLVEANALIANMSAAATELEPRREHAEFLMRELTHSGNQLAVLKGMAVLNGGLWVQSPDLELRDRPGDTPNRLRKARAKALSDS
jgi:hypothetical protein